MLFKSKKFVAGIIAAICLTAGLVACSSHYSCAAPLAPQVISLVDKGGFSAPSSSGSSAGRSSGFSSSSSGSHSAPSSSGTRSSSTPKASSGPAKAAPSSSQTSGHTAPASSQSGASKPTAGSTGNSAPKTPPSYSGNGRVGKSVSVSGHVYVYHVHSYYHAGGYHDINDPYDPFNYYNLDSQYYHHHIVYTGC